MHIVRVSDRPSYRTSCPLVLTMGEHLLSVMHRTGDMLNIYLMHVTIMHITCSETGLKHSPYNSMGEHLPSPMVRGCIQCMLHVSIYHMYEYYEIRSNHNDMFL